MTGQVLVLNATYEPLNVCSLRRACVLLLKSKAELIDALERPLRSASASLPYPVVIRLLSYVRRPRAAARRITRRAVFARDGHSCQYCGVEGVRLTVDHVLPRSRGGPRAGTTPSRPAPPATSARATACRTRSACACAASPARPRRACS